MVGEQPDPGELAVLHRPAQQVPHQLPRLVDRLRSQPAPPHAAVAATEPVLEEQDQVVVVGAEHAVVQGLAVVRLGAAVEQQAGQRDRLRVARLGHGTALALAEHAREQREQGRFAVPQIALVRVRARIEQQPGGADGIATADT